LVLIHSSVVPDYAIKHMHKQNSNRDDMNDKRFRKSLSDLCMKTANTGLVLCLMSNF